MNRWIFSWTEPRGFQMQVAPTLAAAQHLDAWLQAEGIFASVQKSRPRA